GHLAETAAAMGELALPDLLALAVAQRHHVLLRRPIDSHKPSSFSFFVHDALPSDRRHARRACTCTQTHEPPQPHPVAVLALEGAVSPLGIGRGRFTGAHVRFWSSPQLWGAGCHGLLPANRLSSARYQRSGRRPRWRTSFRYAPLRVPPRHYLPGAAW